MLRGAWFRCAEGAPLTKMARKAGQFRCPQHCCATCGEDPPPPPPTHPLPLPRLSATTVPWDKGRYVRPPFLVLLGADWWCKLNEGQAKVSIL